MPLFISFICGFLPMLFFAYLLYWLDRYEKEPKQLLGGVFLWGALVAAGGGFLINTTLGAGVFQFTGSSRVTELVTGTLVAPLIEELLKGCAVLIVFLIFHREFDSVLDGIIYGGITALGFAASENTYYFYANGFLHTGWVGIWSMFLVRVILAGWQHPFYTAFTGIGLALARLNRATWIRILAPLSGFCVAVITHSFHNLISAVLSGYTGLAIGTLIDWIGWLGLICIIIWVINTERQHLIKYLLEEVEQNRISRVQYETAISARLQSTARYSAIFKRCFKNTHRFYTLCGELAHKKYQYTRLGNEDGNLSVINEIRIELNRLSVLI